MQLAELIIQRIRTSPLWSDRTREDTRKIRNLVCQDCGRKKAFTYLNNPWTVYCSHKSCANRTKTLDFFGINFEREFSPSKEDPIRPARAYLQSRGLNRSLEGLSFVYVTNIRNTGAGGVLFPVGEKAGKTVWNGRIFSPPPGVDKGHNEGSTGGCLWRHTRDNYDLEAETFFTEAVINGLSLIEIDCQAVSILSAGADPDSLDISEFKRPILAFDNDPAGIKGLRRWRAKYPAAGAVMPPPGKDWNDLLLDAKSRDKAAEIFQQRRPEFEHNAKLALAETAQAWLTEYCQYRGFPPGLFDFDGEYFFSKKTTKDKQEFFIAEKVSNFTLRVLHIQRDESNTDEPQHRFCLEIQTKKQKKKRCFVASSKELASTYGLREMFLSRGGQALWEGDDPASKALLRKIVNEDCPTVRQPQVIGYDKATKCYTFKDFVIKPDGQLISLNGSGFFELSRQDFIKAGPYPSIKPENGIPAKRIWELLNTAWPSKAAVAIAWMVASWFVGAVRGTLGFFPFLCLTGDVQTGKTRLIRFLNACQALDEEGLSMSRTNTAKGELRRLGQRSSLFMAMLEGNNPESVRFDFEQVLPLYNAGNGLQVRAKTTNDLQTFEVEFQSSLAFVQNRSPFKTKAQRERLISLAFKSDDMTADTTQAFDELCQISLPDFAGFFVEIMKKRQQIESTWFDRYKGHKTDLVKRIADARISENHAIILTFHNLLNEVLDLRQNITPYVNEIALKKKEECSMRNPDLADFFLGTVTDYLDCEEERYCMCLHRSHIDDCLYINLEGFIRALAEDKITLNWQTKDLQAALPGHPSFVKSDHTHRFKYSYSNPSTKESETKNKPKKAYVFDYTKIEAK